MPFNDQLKQTLRERAGYVCEYCHSPERLSANRFTVDHVIPKSLGGSDELDTALVRTGERSWAEFKIIHGRCLDETPIGRIEV